MDVQHIYCNALDNMNLISSYFNPFKTLPPLESSDRQLTHPCEVLTKYINRRKCEIKNRDYVK